MFLITPLCYENIMDNNRFQGVLTSTTVKTFTFKELNKKKKICHLQIRERM